MNEEHHYYEDPESEPFTRFARPEETEPPENETEEEDAQPEGSKTPVIRSNDKCFLTGMNQSGKSVLGRQIILSMVDQIGVIVYDPNYEHTRLIELTSGEIINDVSLIKYMPQIKPGQLVLLQPVDDSPAAWSEFCKSVWDNHRNVFIAIDEAHDVCPAKSVLDPYHQYLIRRGRHFGIGMMHISQRPAETHKMPLAQAQHVMIYKMHLPNDIEYLAGWLQYRELAEEMQKLEPYWYIYYDVNGGQVYVNPPVELI